jgi:diguanylate cyclase (GGDEF)-like protein
MAGVLSNRLALRLIEEAPEGVLVCDARSQGQPVRYVNRRCEQLLRATGGNVVGVSLLDLPMFSAQAEAAASVRAALEQGHGVRICLEVPDRDGYGQKLDVLLEPLREVSGTLTHYVAYLRPQLVLTITAAAELSTEAPPEAVAAAAGAAVAATGARSAREEVLLQESSWHRFQDLLQLQWAAGQRDRHALTLLLFEIDALAVYRETFGRIATDASVRRVARLLSASYRRGTDVLARAGEGAFCALVQSTDLAASTQHAQLIAERVFEMQMHNPRSPRSRFLSLNVGVAHIVPEMDQPPQLLIQAARHAARRAQGEALNRAVIAEAADFAAA